jgi:hypothetical protein
MADVPADTTTTQDEGESGHDVRIDAPLDPDYLAKLAGTTEEAEQ